MAGIEWLQERLQHLQSLSAALVAARSEQQAIDATLNQGLAVFEADQAVIAMLDEDGDRFHIRAVRGYSERIEREWSEFPNNDEYPLSEAVRRQEPVILHGPEELSRRYPRLSDTASSAVLVCLPMGEFGGIALGYEEEIEFTAAEVDFMTAVARQCAEAIRRTELDAERRRRSQRLALLAEAGAVFARSLDYTETLAEVAQLAVPRFADCCIVAVVEPTGLHQVAAVHVDPTNVPEIARLEREYPADPLQPRSAVGEVLREGRPMLVAEVNGAFLDRVTRDAEHRRAVVSLGMRSLIIVPLVARGRTLGAITLVIDSSDRRYDDQDLATARGLADRAALAIDNARLYSAQIEIATTLQRSLLPTELPAIPDVELAARYIAAGEAIEVGGDFYDVWHLGVDGFGVAIGDVSGKGPTAASMTALARHTVRVASLHEATPSRVLHVLNDEICRHVADDMFCTAAYVHAVAAGERGGLDLTISRGGHPPGLMRHPDGSVAEVGQPGTLLGVRGEVELVDERLHLPVGAALVLYTDGVTERRDARELFGEQRLAELVAGLPLDASAEAIVEAIEQTVTGFSAEAPQDDVAIIALRAVPAG